MCRSVRRASARTSKPANTSDRPQLSKDETMEINATQHTAERPFFGMRARRSMSFTAGGELATT
ncbi:hypothetical protein D3C80_1575970 [compost metagenome]